VAYGIEMDTGRAVSADGRWASIASHAFPASGKLADNVVPVEVLQRVSGMFPGTFSPDSRLVVVSGVELSKPGRPLWAAVCELATGAMVMELPGGIMTFGRDNRTLAAAGKETVSFWDLATGREYGKLAAEGLLGNRQEVANGLLFFPDGTKIVTSHTDTTAIVWPVPPRPKAKPLDDAARTAAWDALAGTDAAKAWASIGALADDAGAAAFLKAKLTAVKLPVGKLPAGDALRAVRAIAALEMNGTADARALLTEHAAGADDTTAAEAKRAVERMGK
jgi:hypothetical protein